MKTAIQLRNEMHPRWNELDQLIAKEESIGYVFMGLNSVNWPVFSDPNNFGMLFTIIKNYIMTTHYSLEKYEFGRQWNNGRNKSFYKVVKSDYVRK